MGVPKFYRWLSERYPQINQMISSGTLLPEFDNLYLDMNGIIHTCTHSNDSDVNAKPLTFRQMIQGIMSYIDRIVGEIVKPKKVLFMAIDGVAPRAKLNQQRSRRFRSAQERIETTEKLKNKGMIIDEENAFDSNCITPGTEFMDQVGKHIRWYIRKKMKEDPLWKNLDVIFSGHDVPGEGEHKIMQYIREQRVLPTYHPNTRHCMYGQDADLIMLGLATHEPHFALLREVVNFNMFQKSGPNQRQTALRQTKTAEFQLLHLSILREYIELDLGYNIDDNNGNFSIDKERLIDDFIFLTFFVGNDFLPHLPTLDISEQAFDMIFQAYKYILSHTHEYFITNGEITNMDTLECFCRIIGKQENDILIQREVNEKKFQQKKSRYTNHASAEQSLSLEELEEIEETLQLQYEKALLAMNTVTAADTKEMILEDIVEEEERVLYETSHSNVSATSDDDNDDDEDSTDDASNNNDNNNITSKKGKQNKDDDVLNINRIHISASATTNHIHQLADTYFTQIQDDNHLEVDEEEYHVIKSKRTSKKHHKKKLQKHYNDEEVIEGEELEKETNKDYRGRYYYEKFKTLPPAVLNINMNITEDPFMKELITHYIEGLIWCLAYYSKGCISWTWYFPYHYGPMLQDMRNLKDIFVHIKFTLGQPFKPFQQLLGCLPPASKKLLPASYQWLMTSVNSPCLNFYPLDFNVDMTHKKNPWEATILLPFIDEKILLEAEKNYCHPESLSTEEKQRNSFGNMLYYQYDPNHTETYYSCNTKDGFADILFCSSSMTEIVPDLAPGHFFEPKLVPGTENFLPGFPTLTSINIIGMELLGMKLNVFGSDSKYKTLIIELESSEMNMKKTIADLISLDEKIQKITQQKMSVLLGKNVFVNYPQLHEAKVIGISTEFYEWSCQLDYNTNTVSNINVIKYDQIQSQKWKKASDDEQQLYYKGRSLPGTGGLNIGPIYIRIKVLPLQGMRVNRLTGARVKQFGQNSVDIPLQLILWNHLLDPRFIETEAMPLNILYPHKCEIISISGPYMGCKGYVRHLSEELEFTASGCGADVIQYPDINDNDTPLPHQYDNKSKSTQSMKPAVTRGTLQSEHLKTSKSATGGGSSSLRHVTIEYFLYDTPEPQFGHVIANTMKEEYFSVRDICKILNISPSLLGKVVGCIFVEPGRFDLGLNLKRNGQYQLLGYVRKVENHHHNHHHNNHHNNNGNSNSSNEKKPSVWGIQDTVKLISSMNTSTAMSSTDNGNTDPSESMTATVQWEYSAKAIQLIHDYKTNFPLLFQNLTTLPHKPKYFVTELLGPSGVHMIEEIMSWMTMQPFYHLQRTLLSTRTLSKEAIMAIEKAGDMRTSYLQKNPPYTKIVENVPIDTIFRGDMFTPFDIPISLNTDPPALGDRIVNLTSIGVPFGMKGTVVSIHESTGYVEIIFDEEFVGGKGLQGLCSPGRGRLCPWNGVLLIPDRTIQKTPTCMSTNVTTASLSTTITSHVTSQMTGGYNNKVKPNYNRIETNTNTNTSIHSYKQGNKEKVSTSATLDIKKSLHLTESNQSDTTTTTTTTKAPAYIIGTGKNTHKRSTESEFYVKSKSGQTFHLINKDLELLEIRKNMKPPIVIDFDDLNNSDIINQKKIEREVKLILSSTLSTSALSLPQEPKKDVSAQTLLHLLTRPIDGGTIHSIETTTVPTAATTVPTTTTTTTTGISTSGESHITGDGESAAAATLQQLFQTASATHKKPSTATKTTTITTTITTTTAAAAQGDSGNKNNYTHTQKKKQGENRNLPIKHSQEENLLKSVLHMSINNNNDNTAHNDIKATTSNTELLSPSSLKKGKVNYKDGNNTKGVKNTHTEVKHLDVKKIFTKKDNIASQDIHTSGNNSSSGNSSNSEQGDKIHDVSKENQLKSLMFKSSSSSHTATTTTQESSTNAPLEIKSSLNLLKSALYIGHNNTTTTTNTTTSGEMTSEAAAVTAGIKTEKRLIPTNVLLKHKAKTTTATTTNNK